MTATSKLILQKETAVIALNESHDDHQEHESYEGHSEGIFDLLTDPAHLVVEGISEGFFLLLGAFITWAQLKRRDKRHGHQHSGVA